MLLELELEGVAQQLAHMLLVAPGERAAGASGGGGRNGRIIPNI